MTITVTLNKIVTSVIPEFPALRSKFLLYDTTRFNQLPFQENFFQRLKSVLNFHFIQQNEMEFCPFCNFQVSNPNAQSSLT